MARRPVVERLAALLPREFRERVFEPAWADIRLGERARVVTRLEALWARAVLALECLRIGVPQFVWHRGKPTRAARYTLVVAAVLAVLVLRIMYTRARWQPGR